MAIKIQTQFPEAPSISLGRWMLFGFPLALVLMFVVWFVMVRLYFSKKASQQFGSCSLQRLLLVAAVCFVIVNELLLYVIAIVWCGGWSEPDKCSGTPEGCHHLLLISDPQLQGTLWEHPLLQYVTIPDADTHIWKVYQLALIWLRPSIVAILGDLLDEGFPASDTQFQKYAARFHAIFRTPGNIPVITLPGDNDIGGEGSDRMTPHLVQRFEASFGEVNGMVSLQGLAMLKLELMSTQSQRERPEFKARALQALKNVSSHENGMQAPPIILSHIPLAGLVKKEREAILKTIEPRFLFTGHTHHHATYQYHSITDKNTLIEEHVVPTISYRMGTLDVGFALASISRDGLSLGYKECWFPSRYPSLYSYGVLMVVLGACGVEQGIGWLFTRRSRSKARRY
jgi:hypothetical protein